MQHLATLYKQLTGHDPLSVEPLPQSGSARLYYRIVGPDTATPRNVIGVKGSSVEENEAFFYLADHFGKQRLPVPRVLTISRDRIYYLQTDLGHESLYDALSEGRKAGGRYNLRERQLLKKTISMLPKFQISGAAELDFTKCYPQAEFDKTSVLFDLNYFKYCFLKPLEIDFNEIKLEAVFQRMASELTTSYGHSFMYRDFQARNVMLTPAGEPYFIDFQGGRRGPLEYDVVSFLWQASALYPTKLRNELIDTYIEALKCYTEVNEAQFRERLGRILIFRLLQVLGAYGFRGLVEHKEYFIKSIPPAIANLRAALKKGFCTSPYLYDILYRITMLPQFREKPVEIPKRADGYKTTNSELYKPNPVDGEATFSKYDGKGPLRVRVYSFSYRKGIPEDESGNGGGYVFDVRCTHNPGRYEPYKQLTGLDEPVIRFLEDDGEILTYLKDVYSIVDRHVERYLRRGFTDLMISFGCTGGQHRSVYSAEHVAIHLNEKYGVEVALCHREQNISRTLPARPKETRPATDANK